MALGALVRLPGICEGCKKFRYVRVRPAELWKLSAGLGTPTGICHECETEEEEHVRRINRPGR